MPKLSPISRRRLIQKLRKLGFQGPYSGRRHQYMVKNSQIIFIPNPHKKDIGVPILKQIIKQLKVKREDFIKL